MIRKQAPMCKSRGSASASNPQPRLTNRTSASRSRSSSTALPTSSSSGPAAATSTSFTGGTNSTASSASRASLTSLRESLPENPTLYPFLEISSATNHFLAPRLATSSSSWRCSLRGRDVVVVQGPFLSGDHSSLLTRLSALSRAHHSAIIPLLGASLAPPHLYLVYEFAPGAPLSLLLRNPRNPSFTPLSSWSSRVKIAADLAQGLDYIHNHSAATGIRGGPVHNRIKSSSIIVSEPDLRARICHFGAVVLSGQILNEVEEISPSPSANISRTDSRRMRIEGTRGYMAPEVMSGSQISQSSDVYAFGVVLLELLSGEEPLKYKIQKATRDFERISLIGTAREVIGDGDEEAVAEMTEHREGRLRRWVDGRLRDSFPVGAAERLVRVALRCVEEAPAARPGMEWVAGRVSKVLVESKAWEGRIRPPTDFSVSMAPR